MIVLLDYQFTLCHNSKTLPWPPTKETVPREEYRDWLWQALKPHRVVLVTVRWNDLKEMTLQNIREKCPGFKLEGALFNFWRLPAPESKRRNVLTHVIPKYGPVGGQYLAIESNRDTREMYAQLGIPAVRHDDPNLMRYLSGEMVAAAEPEQGSLL